MQIAWTSLLIAVLLQRGVKPFFKEKGRYLRVDGRPKTWDYTKLVAACFGVGVTNAVTKNLLFIEGLRNHIEHSEMPELDVSIFGECQALLFNFEDLLTKEFGTDKAINECLTFALQFSTHRWAEQDTARRKLHRPLTKNIAKYIETFRSSLSTEIAASQQYSFKVFLVPNIAANRSAEAVAVEWVRTDPDSPEDAQFLQQLTAIVKLKPTYSLRDLHKAGTVCKQVAARISPKTFGTNIHAVCAVEYGARPPSNSRSPEKTNEEWCIYEPLNKNYGYTKAWTDFLVEKMSDHLEFDRMRSKLKGRARVKTQAEGLPFTSEDVIKV